MATPLKNRLFDAFLGSEEGIHSVILPQIFSSGGSKNVYIDKYARVAKMRGYLKQNSSAYTTDTGASASRVVGLFPYRNITTGTITRKTVFVLDDGVDEFELWYSADSGATGTFSVDLGSASVGSVPEFCQFGNDLFFTNGVVAPRVTSNGTSWSTAGGTQSPTPTPTVGTTAGVLNGDYLYKLVSRKSDNTRSPGSVSTSVKGAQLVQISLAWTADADTNVTGYEVYRTTGTGATFYYVGWVDGRTTVAFTDNVSDDTIVGNRPLEEHGDAPPTGTYFAVPHKQRVWWLKTDTNPTRAYFSDAGDADSVYSSNFIDFADTDTIGDQLTGAVGDIEGRLVVFTERAVWTVTGTGVLQGTFRDWTRSRTNAQVGAVSKKSIVRIPAGAKFADQNGVIQTTDQACLAYFTPYGDIRLFFLGGGDQVISLPVKSTLAAFDYANRKYVHALHDAENQQIIWFYPATNTDPTTYPAKAVVWNYRWGVWYPWTSMPFAASCASETSGDPIQLLVGESSTTTGAYIYNFFTGTSWNGSAIPAQWMTKSIRGQDALGNEDLSHTQRWRWVDVLLQTNSTGGPITLEWIGGNDQDDAGPQWFTTVDFAGDQIQCFDDAGNYIQTSDGEPIYIVDLTTQARVMLNGPHGGALSDGGYYFRYFHDTGIRFRFYDSSTTSDWALEGFNLYYQTMEGLKRRAQ